MIGETQLVELEGVSDYDILCHRYESRIDELLMGSSNYYTTGIMLIPFWGNYGKDACPPDSSALRDVLERYSSSWGDVGAFMINKDGMDIIYILFKSSILNEKVSVEDVSELGTLVRVVY